MYFPHTPGTQDQGKRKPTVRNSLTFKYPYKYHNKESQSWYITCSTAIFGKSKYLTQNSRVKGLKFFRCNPSKYVCPDERMNYIPRTIPASNPQCLPCLHFHKILYIKRIILKPSSSFLCSSLIIDKNGISAHFATFLPDCIFW